jgi:hypothetical protein
METWQGPWRGYQELVGPWAFLTAVGVLLLAAVTANAMADTHPTLGRWREAAARAVDRAARRLWAHAAPAAVAALRTIAEATDRSLRAVRTVIDEQWSARRRPTATDAPADVAGPAPATS